MSAEPIRHRPGGAQIIPRPTAWRRGGPPPWHDAGRSLPTVAELVHLIATETPREQAPPFPDARSSAVLVVLHQGEDGPETLLTRRAAHLRHHRGEISFPGGRVDPGEEPAAAALREADEEVGLDPALVTVHGQLDHLSTVVSQSYIVPVVASVEARPVLTASASEVDRILWVHLAELARADTYREELWGLPPLERSVHFFELDDETVWGATGRMLVDLLTRAFGGRPLTDHRQL